MSTIDSSKSEKQKVLDEMEVLGQVQNRLGRRVGLRPYYLSV